MTHKSVFIWFSTPNSLKSILPLFLKLETKCLFFPYAADLHDSPSVNKLLSTPLLPVPTALTEGELEASIPLRAPSATTCTVLAPSVGFAALPPPNQPFQPFCWDFSYRN